MNGVRRRALLLAAGMGATSGLAVLLKPPHIARDEASRVDLGRIIPTQVGAWQIDRVAETFVRAADRRGVKNRYYDQVLERTFVNPRGQRVMLSVAYLSAQSSDVQLHRPEVCYRAGGFRVGELQAAQLRVGNRNLRVTRLIAKMPGRPEPITYWMVIAGIPDIADVSPWRWRLERNLKGQDTAGVLVRISSIDSEPERAFHLHTDFAADLWRALAPVGRDLVMGSPVPG